MHPYRLSGGLLECKGSDKLAGQLWIGFGEDWLAEPRGVELGVVAPLHQKLPRALVLPLVQDLPGHPQRRHLYPAQGNESRGAATGATAAADAAESYAPPAKQFWRQNPATVRWRAPRAALCDSSAAACIRCANRCIVASLLACRRAAATGHGEGAKIA